MVSGHSARVGNGAATKWVYGVFRFVYGRYFDGYIFPGEK